MMPVLGLGVGVGLRLGLRSELEGGVGDDVGSWEQDFEVVCEVGSWGSG